MADEIEENFCIFVSSKELLCVIFLNMIKWKPRKKGRNVCESFCLRHRGGRDLNFIYLKQTRLPLSNQTASKRFLPQTTRFRTMEDTSELSVIRKEERKKIKKEKQDERVNGKGNGVRTAVKMSGKHAHWLHELPDVI